MIASLNQSSAAGLVTTSASLVEICISVGVSQEFPVRRSEFRVLGSDAAARNEAERSLIVNLVGEDFRIKLPFLRDVKSDEWESVSFGFRVSGFGWYSKPETHAVRERDLDPFVLSLPARYLWPSLRTGAGSFPLWLV